MRFSGDLIMPPLAGDTVDTIEHFAANNNSAADTRAENETVNDLSPFAGAEDRLREGKAIGIIGHENFASQNAG